MTQNAAEFYQVPFLVTPKRFNAIDMFISSGKFVLFVMYTKMLCIAKINQAIVAWPTVWMNLAIYTDMAPDNLCRAALDASGTISVRTMPLR